MNHTNRKLIQTCVKKKHELTRGKMSLKEKTELKQDGGLF